MKLPITAIVIFRNEKHHLDRCLAALSFCDELICIDMCSTDGSREIATKYATRLMAVDPYPIAEPTRVVAAEHAKHDWLLYVDPDEVIPETLAEDMERMLREQPEAGAFSLPMWFYFKGQQLTGTFWGTLTYKRRLIHRERCQMLPLCNRLNEMKAAFEDLRVPFSAERRNHMQHYWSDSYVDLAKRHLTRYCHTEAQAVAAKGQRFSLWLGFVYPFKELKRTLKDFDGWRLGMRGWLLSAIYFAYVVANSWLVLRYQNQTQGAEVSEAVDGIALPILRDVYPASDTNEDRTDAPEPGYQLAA